MAEKKRYYYDAKGNLKGFSTDKYTPTFKGVFGIMAVVIVVGVLSPKSENDSSSVATQPSANESSIAIESLVTGTANVRADPTTKGRIVGSLLSGDKIRVEAAEGEAARDWVKLIGGPLSGNFVWRGNLRDIEARELVALESMSDPKEYRSDEPSLEEQGYPPGMSAVERCMLGDQQACKRKNRQDRERGPNAVR